MLSYSEVVRLRHSVRGFLPTEIPDMVLTEIIEEAQLTPSNCNTQPWCVHIVSGEKRKELSSALMHSLRAKQYSLDFTFDKNSYPEPYRTRAFQQGRDYYQALGVEREDVLSRTEIVERNVRFFDAPHVALLFMPVAGDNVRVASDVGMYAQTFLLSLAARSYAGVPQAALSYFADTVRSVLNVSDDLKLLFGISFGIPDTAHCSNLYREGRVSTKENVTWHE